MFRTSFLHFFSLALSFVVASFQHLFLFSLTLAIFLFFISQPIFFPVSLFPFLYPCVYCVFFACCFLYYTLYIFLLCFPVFFNFLCFLSLNMASEKWVKMFWILAFVELNRSHKFACETVVKSFVTRWFSRYVLWKTASGSSHEQFESNWKSQKLFLLNRFW